MLKSLHKKFNASAERIAIFSDDVIEGLLKIIECVPSMQSNECTKGVAPYSLYNIGNNNPVTLRRFITCIEDACGKKAKENLMPMQAGNVPITFADIDTLLNAINFKPSTNIEDGIKRFVDWYREFSIFRKISNKSPQRSMPPKTPN